MPLSSELVPHGTIPALTPRYMSASRPVLVLVGGHASPIGRLMSRAAPNFSVLQCPTVQDGLQAVSSGRIRLLACEARDARGESTDPLLGTVAANFASVGIVGIVPRSRVEGGALVRLIQSGAHALLLADDRLTVLDCRRVLTEAVVKSGVSARQAVILAAAPPRVRRLLEYGLRYAHEPVTVAGAARALGVNRKTLFWWCAEAGLPAPQQLLGWCRLLAVATLLEDSGRRVDHIALDLDFPSGAALRNLLHRYCGVSPSQLRGEGALPTIRRQFLAAVSGVAR